jgi:hypothetical protein
VRTLGTRWIWLLPLAAACGLLVVLLASSGDGDPSGADAGDGVQVGAPPPAPFEEDKTASGKESPTAPRDEPAVRRAVTDYVEGVSAHDGERVCAVLAPGAIQTLPLPRERGECAASLSASIGYRDPRGFPVFDRARLDSIGEVVFTGGGARATAKVVTRFADRDQPSIEDDVIYLVASGGEWRVVKPSATLYRAVGKPEAPPQVLAPPE